MSIIVGLTGPSGAGKSMAAKCAEKAGFFVVDCDKIAREAVSVGSPGLQALVDAFGEEILSEDASLNRRALADYAFSSETRTELLNNVLLPHIVALIEPELIRPVVLLDAPTLYESGLSERCNITIAVLAERFLRLSRIIGRDGLTIKEAERRLSAGKPDSFYIERADKILYNNGDTADFFKKAEKTFYDIYGGNYDG